MKVCNAEVEPLCPNTLVFEEARHLYSRNDNGKWNPCCSATTFIKCLHPEFDSEKHAYNSAMRDGIYNEDGYPDTKAILEKWDAKRDRAANFGTLLHNCMESYLLHGSIDHYVDNFDGDLFQYLPNITPEDKDRILLYLRDNIDDLDKMLKPFSVSKEDYDKMVYYPEHRLTYSNREGFLCPFISGTADLVILHPDGKTVSIGDYKTNENLFKKGYNYMFYGFQDEPFHLTDSSLDKYTVQLNLYASMIKSYGFEIGELFLIWMPSTLHKAPKRVNITNYLTTDKYINPFKDYIRQAYAGLLTKYPNYNNH